MHLHSTAIFGLSKTMFTSSDCHEHDFEACWTRATVSSPTNGKNEMAEFVQSNTWWKSDFFATYLKIKAKYKYGIIGGVSENTIRTTKHKPVEHLQYIRQEAGNVTNLLPWGTFWWEVLPAVGLTTQYKTCQVADEKFGHLSSQVSSGSTRKYSNA